MGPAQLRVGGWPTGASTLKHDAYGVACPKRLGPSDSVETPVGPPPPEAALKGRAVGGAEKPDPHRP